MWDGSSWGGYRAKCSQLGQGGVEGQARWLAWTVIGSHFISCLTKARVSRRVLDSVRNLHVLLFTQRSVARTPRQLMDGGRTSPTKPRRRSLDRSTCKRRGRNAIRLTVDDGKMKRRKIQGDGVKVEGDCAAPIDNRGMELFNKKCVEGPILTRLATLDAAVMHVRAWGHAGTCTPVRRISQARVSATT